MNNPLVSIDSPDYRHYRISIIIPIYNVQEYIGRCLDSIFLQECDEADIECIVVNDCTPDQTMSIVDQKLQEYSVSGGRISFVIKHHSQNKGHCAARNTGLKDAKGDYILFVDADDYLLPDTIHRYIVEMHRYGDGEIDVVMGNALNSVNNKPLTSIGEDCTVLVGNSEEEGLRKLMKREIFHTSWNKMVKRKFFTEDRLFFEEGIINEDLLWSYLLFLHARNILFLPQVTYVYKDDNANSITNTSTSRIPKIIASRIIICNTILSTPPRTIIEEYYTYLFYIFSRALNMYEQNSKWLYQYQGELYSIRRRLLNSVWKRGYYPLFFFFLSSVKPFYYITLSKLYRRYFDKFSGIAISLSKKFHF